MKHEQPPSAKCGEVVMDKRLSVRLENGLSSPLCHIRNGITDAQSTSWRGFIDCSGSTALLRQALRLEIRFRWIHLLYGGDWSSLKYRSANSDNDKLDWHHDCCADSRCNAGIRKRPAERQNPSNWNHVHAGAAQVFNASTGG